MTPEPTALPGVILLRPARHVDARGDFVKLLHRPSFEAWGLALEVAEQYVTTSAAGVVRGLHFQTPPHDHAKLVTCLAGRAFDVVVDLRRGSPAYGRFACLDLRGEERTGVFIPPGCAHGFCALEHGTTLLYSQGTPHAPAHDAGILWSSLPIPWPVAQPVLSARDRAFPGFAGFETPFV